MDNTFIAPGPSAAGVDLTGRSALVTGAASGIGRACAERLARAGAAVTVLDLDGDAARRVAGEIGGGAQQADLSDYGVLDGLEVDADIVVNNAGLQHVAAVEEFPPERFSLILRIMLEAPFRILQKALPGMYEKGWGRVVNVTSAASLHPPASTASGPRRTRRRTSPPSTAWRASPRPSPSKGDRRASPPTASTRRT